MNSLDDFDFTYFAPIHLKVESFEVRYRDNLLFAVDYDTETKTTKINFSRPESGNSDLSIPLPLFEEILKLANKKFSED